MPKFSNFLVQSLGVLLIGVAVFSGAQSRACAADLLVADRLSNSVYRYSAIASRLWKAGALEPLGIAANLGYRFYAHHLHRFYNCDWHLSAVPSIQKAVCG